MPPQVLLISKEMCNAFVASSELSIAVSDLTSKEKYKIAGRIMSLAGIVWAIDAGTKYWALQDLVNHPVQLIPNFLYLFLGTNPGGSFGIPSQFMEFCLTMPATMVFIMALWMRLQIKAGKSIPVLQQLGLGLLMGGALGNWSERVVHSGVTDFIYLQWFSSCIFNLADFSIDLGFLVLVFEAIKITIKTRVGTELDVAK